MLVSICVATSRAQIPRTLSYQGVLTDNNGDPRNGTFNITFKLYDVATGGTPIWTQLDTITTSRGVFSTTLGKSPFDASLLFDKQYWLGIQVTGEAELTPRVALTSVGYSLSSVRADTARVVIEGDGLWDRGSGSNIYRLNGNVGIGTNAPGTKLDVFGRSRAQIFESRGTGTSSSERMTMISAAAAQDNQISSRDENGTRLWVLNMADRSHDNRFGLFSDVAQSYVFVVSKDGDVAIGTNSSSTAKLAVAGRTRTNVLEITGGMDLAEPFEMSHAEALEPGSVVIIDEDNPGKLKLSSEPYDKRVAGVVSGAGGVNPGLTLKQEGLMENGQNVALSGRVYVKASASNGSIKPGDMLTTSSLEGHAMKATDKELSHGAIIGKAMSSLEAGEGLVLVLVNLQ